MTTLKLYLLRHSDAAEPGAGGVARDFDRPLTRDGRRKARRVGSGLRRHDVHFDVILSSPAVRARQTAELVAARLRDAARVRFTDNLLIGGSRDRLYKELGQLPAKTRSVLLVGHEPFLGNLVSHLLTGRTGLPLRRPSAPASCSARVCGPALPHGRHPAA